MAGASASMAKNGAVESSCLASACACIRAKEAVNMARYSFSTFALVVKSRREKHIARSQLCYDLEALLLA